MTYESPLSCSVLMSKFIASPRLGVAGSLTRRRWRKLLDERPDLARVGRVWFQLQVVLVARHRGLDVARLLSGLRHLEPGARIVRLQRRHLLVGADGVRERELRLRLKILNRGVRVRRGRLLQLVRADRLAELARRQEARARRRELGRLVRRLVLPEVVLRLGQLEPAELVPGGDVLRLLDRVLLQRRDRVRRVVLALVRGREVAVALRFVRVLLDLLLRLRDRRAAAREDVQAGEELVEAAVRAGADAEEGEGDTEEDCEDEIHGLRLAPHPDEEELLIRVAPGRVPAPACAPGRRLRRFALLL